MKRTIFAGAWGFTLVAVLVTSAAVSLVMYGELSARLRQETKREAEYISAGLDAAGSAYYPLLGKEPAGNRVKLLAADGAVLYDSDPREDADNVGRPAVLAAVRNGYGEDVSASGLPGRRAVSCAVRRSDGSVLLVTNTIRGVFPTMVSLLPSVLLLGGFFWLISLALTRRKRKRLTRTITALDLENPLMNDTYEELSPLLTRIAKQNAELGEKAERTRKWQEEFSAVTEYMREGLVVLDAKAFVLSMNHSALRMLGVPEGDYEGRHILTVNRNLALQSMIRKAMEGTSCERLFSRDGRHYLVMANPVQSQGETKGILLLLLDVTEKQNAEQMRREFSANVSHELKTPLTSISGYAELMKEGLVKPDDIEEFSRRIYSEACQLILLIEDIMKLSRLDEENPRLTREEVELLALSRSVAERLAPRGEKTGVSLTVSGEKGVICGSKQILEEMIYNLCDNAIKYNRQNGSVRITVTPADEHVSLTVEDTGIGIPKEDQERVFERFYRVDKSHSKQTGGTGLGLSIVKHGAVFHNAKVELDSTEGVGTKIRLIFSAGGSKS